MGCGVQGGGQHKRQDVCLHGTKRGRRSEVGEVNNTLSCFRFFGLQKESVAGFVKSAPVSVLGVLCKWVKFCQKPVAHQKKMTANDKPISCSSCCL